MLDESVTERDESGTLEIAPEYVAPGFTYPVSNWGDAFRYGSQIGTNALYFDGDSHIEFAFNHTFSGPEGGVWTNEFLLHPECVASMSADEYVTLFRADDETSRGVIRLRGDGSVEFGNPASSDGLSHTEPHTIRDEQAQRLSVTWGVDANERRVYVDGQLEATFSWPSYTAITLSTDDPLTYRLGADDEGDHGYLGGMDDVRFWADSEARSQQAIFETRDKDLLETETDLTALPIYFRFDDMSDSTSVINDGNSTDYETTVVGAEYQDAFGQLEEVQYSLGTGDTISLDFDISGRIDTELIKTRRVSRSNRRSL